MDRFTTVADARDLPPGGSLCIEFGGERVALFNVGGSLHAIGDACTHAGGPLSLGHVVGSTVVCPLHGAAFDLTTGRATCAPGSGSVKLYRVRTDGGEIQLAEP